MIGAGIRAKGDRGRRRFCAATALAALAIGLNVGVPAKADEAMIEGCLKAAAEVHHVPAGVLVLLISVEAGRLGAVSQNANGTVDIGPMQVNDTWLSKIAGHWGASREEAYRALRDSFCANVEGGAWILRQALDEARGDLWEGVALYHSHTPVHKLEYMRLVYEQAMRLKREAGVRRRARLRAPIPGEGGRMARSSRGGGAIGSDDYTGFSLILIVVGLCILGWASWHVWHAQISRIALLVAHYEMEAIGVVTDRFQARRHRGSTRSSRPGSVRSARAALSQHRPGVRLSRHGAGSGAGGLMLSARRQRPLHPDLRSRKADGRAGDPFPQHGGVRRSGLKTFEAARRRPASGRRRAACG